MHIYAHRVSFAVSQTKVLGSTGEKRHEYKKQADELDDEIDRIMSLKEKEESEAHDCGNNDRNCENGQNNKGSHIQDYSTSTSFCTGTCPSAAGSPSVDFIHAPLSGAGVSLSHPTAEMGVGDGDSVQARAKKEHQQVAESSGTVVDEFWCLSDEEVRVEIKDEPCAAINENQVRSESQPNGVSDRANTGLGEQPNSKPHKKMRRGSADVTLSVGRRRWARKTPSGGAHKAEPSETEGKLEVTLMNLPAMTEGMPESSTSGGAHEAEPSESEAEVTLMSLPAVTEGMPESAPIAMGVPCNSIIPHTIAEDNPVARVHRSGPRSGPDWDRDPQRQATLKQIIARRLHRRGVKMKL